MEMPNLRLPPPNTKATVNNDHSQLSFISVEGHYYNKVAAISLRSMLYLNDIRQSVFFLRRLKPIANLLTAQGGILRHAAQDKDFKICDRKGNFG
jgi:hypothetical protein